MPKIGQVRTTTHQQGSLFPDLDHESGPATYPGDGIEPRPEPDLDDEVRDPGRRPSVGQLVRDAFARQQPSNRHPHIIVIARAGTGKTTTAIGGLRYMRGMDPGVVPSPQQLAIWESLALSRDARHICMTAYNVTIADELRRRVPQGVHAMTMHSMGVKAVTRAFGRQDPNDYVVQDMLGDLYRCDPRDLKIRRPTFVAAVDELVSLMKSNLTDPGDPRAIAELMDHHAIDVEGECVDEIVDRSLQLLEACADPRGRIMFDDMVWLPVRHKLSVFRYDLLVVDESQDLTPCQQQLAWMAGDRLGFIGDDRQAIYGFAGADDRAIANLRKRAEATSVGVTILPLTVTRRCGHAIVADAKAIVPDFEAHPDNPPGLTRRATIDIAPGSIFAETYHDLVQDGDMILCRVNAPLVGQCLRFLRHSRKASIRGRDMIKNLRRTIEQARTDEVPKLIAWVERWLRAMMDAEAAKKNPDENKVIAAIDRRDCIVGLCEGCESVGEVLEKLDAIFFDKICPECGARADRRAEKCRRCRVPLVVPEGIILSSIHKAKGLEARRVFLLEPKGATVPHPMARTASQRGQEMNLRYVAITRAIEELTYVS